MKKTPRFQHPKAQGDRHSEFKMVLEKGQRFPRKGLVSEKPLVVGSGEGKMGRRERDRGQVEREPQDGGVEEGFDGSQ